MSKATGDLLSHFEAKEVEGRLNLLLKSALMDSVEIASLFHTSNYQDASSKKSYNPSTRCITLHLFWMIESYRVQWSLAVRQRFGFVGFPVVPMALRRTIRR
jgi:hypothetical protein